MECNCSHCSRKGYLLTFIPHEQLTLSKGAESLSTYTFNKHVIHHHFCKRCGCAPFGVVLNPKGGKMAAINVRCLEELRSGGHQAQARWTANRSSPERASACWSARRRPLRHLG